MYFCQLLTQICKQTNLGSSVFVSGYKPGKSFNVLSAVCSLKTDLSHIMYKSWQKNLQKIKHTHIFNIFRILKELLKAWRSTDTERLMLKAQSKRGPFPIKVQRGDFFFH